MDRPCAKSEGCRMDGRMFRWATLHKELFVDRRIGVRSVRVDPRESPSRLPLDLTCLLLASSLKQ